MSFMNLRAMSFMNLRAAVGRRTLVKQSSVSRNEPSNICLPSSSRRTEPDLKIHKSDSAITKHVKQNTLCLAGNLRTKFKVFNNVCSFYCVVQVSMYHGQESFQIKDSVLKIKRQCFP